MFLWLFCDDMKRISKLYKYDPNKPEDQEIDNYISNKDDLKNEKASIYHFCRRGAVLTSKYLIERIEKSEKAEKEKKRRQKNKKNKKKKKKNPKKKK